MESKVTEFTAETTIEPNITAPLGRIFLLYEEYSHEEISETVRLRRIKYETADYSDRLKMMRQVEDEIAGFSEWLKQTKGLEPVVAYYCSQGLKSLLFGIPTGMQIACLFGLALENRL